MTPKPLKMADLFCGAGGTSTGAVEAAHLLNYRPQLTAINHWPVAVATHTLNHPHARHLCTNIDEVNPRELYREGELDLLWASPECRFHSNARGGRPVLEQGRPTAWCVPRWLEAVRPRRVLVENVPEFVKWGPRKNGSVFRAWFEACRSMGYWGEWRVFCAADYGDPTTRRRLIVQFVKKGCGRIVWPEPTHRDPELGPISAGLLPWVPAADIIDWNLKGQWLDEMPGKSRFGGLPISPKTLARLYAGFEDHSGARFIVPKDNFDGKRTRSLKRPLHTVTANSRSEALVEPYIVQAGARERKPRGVSKPLGAVLTKDHPVLVEPFILPKVGFFKGNRAASLKRPLKTVIGDGRMHLVEPVIVPGFGERKGQRPRTHSVRKPMPAITASGHHHLLQPYVVEFDHQSGKRGTRKTSEPLSTVTTKGRHSLVQPFLVQLRGTSPAQVAKSGRSILKPLGTLTAGGGHVGLVQPFLHHTAHGGNRRSRKVSEPLPAVAGNRGDLALCSPALLPQSQGGKLRPVTRPVPTIATDGAIALLEAYLVEYYGAGGSKSVRKPMATITTKDRFALVCPEVVIDGRVARVRFRWRMLQPHELAPGQGFRRDYKFKGNKSEQVKQIGNAVPRRLARALVLAALGQCGDIRRKLAGKEEAA